MLRDRSRAAVVAAAIALLAPATASAFCGFYVNTDGKPMFNNATQVVLVRVGTRTVLSMQNNYQGPPEGFAMVVPVPVVLTQEHVKTLSREVFDKIDLMGSPRLVEYWERDPCDDGSLELEKPEAMSVDARDFAKHEADDLLRKGVVKVEAKFEVGEYQVVVLSATESTGLDTWLRAEHYKIPDGAEPLLRPYVASGSKFFVARVDPTKVKFEGDQARLSPLRFDYDSDELVLPVRLGLANSSGTQDLIINLLGETRFETTNRKNVAIPTNLEVAPNVRDHFGKFYASLFDRTLAQNPGAAITEYAWTTSGCDPCPGPTLDGTDLGSLGFDVISPNGTYNGDITHTRLHLRYTKNDSKDDIVFAKAGGITGGREEYNESGKLELGATEASSNNFQGRYVIRHRWPGKLTCKDPIRGRWGEPWPGEKDLGLGSVTGHELAFSARDLATLEADLAGEGHAQLGVQSKPHGCGCQSTSPAEYGAGGAVFALVLRRRRRRRAASR